MSRVLMTGSMAAISPHGAPALTRSAMMLWVPGAADGADVSGVVIKEHNARRITRENAGELLHGHVEGLLRGLCC